MDSQKNTWIAPLGEPPGLDANLVGGKAASLAKMISADIRIPPGFCLTVFAYQQFLNETGLSKIIQMELGRKSLNKMRWEEIWDTALRIRSAFLRAPLSPKLAQAIHKAVNQLNPQRPLAVRSSAIGEDSAQRSFAGLHESIVNVRGEKSVLQAVRTVWSSLWSDAALLYRKELLLDPQQSQMAVIVQEMIPAEISGVAFGRDPRNQAVDREIVEAVPGPCSNLVDGLLEPDRWILRRSTGEIVERQEGKRDYSQANSSLLSNSDLSMLHEKLRQVEELFGWPPDMEWAKESGQLSILQARPITSGLSAENSDERGWYLTLRPKFIQLRRLADKVSKTLIPTLDQIGRQLAGDQIEALEDRALANCIEERLSILISWQEIYKNEFIPLAHGVRYLGAYYNDALQPQDPYEFIGLLEGQDFLALHRNAALFKLAQHVNKNRVLQRRLAEFASVLSQTSSVFWADLNQQVADIQGGDKFLVEFKDFLSNFMDTSFNGERLIDRPDSLVNLIHQLGTLANEAPTQNEKNKKTRAMALEQRLLQAVGRSREDEAREVIDIGQLSWRLRDDDNILLGRIESQFLRALHLGEQRLRIAGRLSGRHANEKSAALVVQALRDPTCKPLRLEENQANSIQHHTDLNEKPRQLIGQPTSPGLAEGPARVVNGIKDFHDFQRGDVLVCDSIQPAMTHLVPLASAIVERRGGMLIHGAIIARELGIPCVNGVSNVTSLVRNGNQLMVDGYLGIVTLGAPEFELEERAHSSSPY